MKNLNVTIGNTVLQFSACDQLAIVAALATVQVLEKDWDGTLTPKPTNPTFEFVTPTTPEHDAAVAEAQKQKEQYSGYWQQTIKERDEARKESSELRQQLESLNETVDTLRKLVNPTAPEEVEPGED